MTFLEEVLLAKEREISILRASPPALIPAGPRPGFRDALKGPALSVIAEIKRKSPSKGSLAPGLDSQKTAQAYASGGAAALSCLTDAGHFGALPGDLTQAASAGLPVLRKDFLIDEIQVDESVAMGASAVLLIVRILKPERLAALLRHAADHHLDALVEVHDESEIDQALAAGALTIGVNNRDLATLTVDPDRALRLRPRIPPGVLSVAESGVKTREDVKRIEDAGFSAVLIGETLARSSDPALKLQELLGRPGGGRS